jgi:hypothetical protein
MKGLSHHLLLFLTPFIFPIGGHFIYLHDGCQQFSFGFGSIFGVRVSRCWKRKA